MPSVFGTAGFGTIVVRESGVVKHAGASELDFVGATVTKSGQVAVVTIVGGGGGDHGTLTGLGDDDHPQYLLRTDLDKNLTYTKNLIDFDMTVASGYTYSRFNPIIEDGNEIIVEDGGEFVIL